MVEIMGAVILTAAQVREMVAGILRDTIEQRRASRSSLDPNYRPPTGDVTDEEVDNFIAANPEPILRTPICFSRQVFWDLTTVFASGAIEAYDDFEQEVEETVRSLAEDETWLRGAFFTFTLIPGGLTQVRRRLWLPRREPSQPQWIETSPSALFVARELIEEGRLLSELDWREFERLVAELLERDGWNIQLLRGTKDGGIDVISSRSDPVVGPLKTVWQAKRYGEGRKVQLSHARELSGVAERERATKGVLVTTTSLTRERLTGSSRTNLNLAPRTAPMSRAGSRSFPQTDSDAEPSWLGQFFKKFNVRQREADRVVIPAGPRSSP